ncbi:MAG: cohesin domain-containing protein, partial [Saprospiraceae bacterium]
AQDTLALDIQSKTGPKGSTVCLNVTARNFKNIESIQFNLSYNATLVSPQCPSTNVHPGLKNNIFGELFNCNSKVNGFINFVWASDPTTIPDGDILFTLCFDIIGNPGNTSPVSINGNILEMEVCREISGKTVCLNKVNTTPASIDIKTNTLSIFINKCDADIINTTDKGSLSFYATGGLAPYSYNINSGEFTGNGLADGQRTTLNNLPQKAYNIVITDASGLPVSSSKTISSNIPFAYDKSTINPLCADRDNGSIKIYNVRGGIPPYMYEWSNLVSDVTSQDSLVLKKLYVGKYSVTITDFNGCKKTDSFELVRAPLLMAVKILSNAACSQPGVFGSIEISASGGTPFSTGDPYTLTINSGLNFKIKPPYLYSPRAGNFTLRISDANFCSTDIRPYFMPSDYTIDMTAAVKDISCKNAKDGSVSLTVSPYSKDNSFFPLFGYPDLSGGRIIKDDTLKLTGISPGSYAYRMIDVNNCRDTVFFTVKEPDSLKINSTLVNPECDKPGSITLNPLGGNASYNYIWNPLQAGNVNSLSNLTGGTFKVTVSDANNCKDSLSVTLNQQGTINVNPEKVRDISCNGANDGILRVDIQSLNGPFDVKWKDSLGTVVSIGQTILNVKPGTYTVQVTDKSMCSSIPMAVTISEPAPFFITLKNEPATCNNENGQAFVNVTGGNSGYTFEWQKSGNSTIISTDTILNNKAGLYVASAINSVGCRIKDSITINEPNSIQFNEIVVQTNCDLLGSIALNPSGGTPGYRYLWSVASAGDTSLIKNLSGGQYSVTVTDSNNCTASFTQIINQQGKPEITTESQNISCFGAKNGSLKVNIQSPNSPFGVVWKDSTGTTISSQPTVQNIGPGNYTIQVTDKNNCSSEIKQVVITEPDSLALIKNISNAICFQDQGSILVNVTGGSGSYKYEWQKAGNALVIDNDSLLISSAGKYVFKITDGNNCIKTETIPIDEPAKLIIPTPNVKKEKCFGSSDGLAAIFLPEPGINYTWSTGSIGPFVVNMPAGKAWVIGSNINNCVSDTAFFEIESPLKLQLDGNSTIISNPSCFGSVDGSISVAAIGGTGSSYRYSWQNGPNGSFISGLGVGNYIVTIRDSLDCTAIDSVTLTQ